MRRRSSAPLTVYALALLLVFKAAVPMLASAAASAQGRAVGEICSVYGVVLPKAAPAAPAPHDSDPHAHHHADPHAGHNAAADAGPEADHAAHGDAALASAEHSAPGDPGTRHGADHCALTALAALAGGDDQPALRLPAPAGATASSPSAVDVLGRDASARWAARLGHGPPVSS